MGVVVTSITNPVVFVSVGVVVINALASILWVVVEVVVEMVTVILQSACGNICFNAVSIILTFADPAKGGQLTYGIIFHLRHKPVVAYSLKSHAYRPYVRTARSRNGDDNGTTARSASLQMPLRTT